MKVFACPEAKDFLDAWPGLVSVTEHELGAEAAIASTFSEASTQTAFMSLAARQKEFETSLRVQTAQLNILKNRTEPLSPSYKQSGSSMHSSLINSATTGSLRGEEPAHGSESDPPSLCTHCGHQATLDSDEQLPTASIPVLPPADPVGAGIPPHSSVNTLCHTTTPIMPTPNDLSVVPIKAHNHLFHVLRLAPGGPMAPPTPFDIILPSAAAFFDGAEKLQANQTQYPKFTATNCGWHAIFECIAQPALLWDCWGPGSLGEYVDVLTLWKSWDEGMMIEGVGQRPPLRLVDARWGCHRDMRSKKGHLAAWRPRNDENVGILHMRLTA